MTASTARRFSRQWPPPSGRWRRAGSKRAIATVTAGWCAVRPAQATIRIWKGWYVRPAATASCRWPVALEDAFGSLRGSRRPGRGRAAGSSRSAPCGQSEPRSSTRVIGRLALRRDVHPDETPPGFGARHRRISRIALDREAGQSGGHVHEARSPTPPNAAAATGAAAGTACPGIGEP